MDPDQIKQAQAFSDAMQAARNGSIDAALLLGLMYDRGIATQSSRDQALYWYEKASHNPISAFILGTYAAQESGASKNMDKALDYLQFSVDKGFPEANYNLAVLKYQQGKPFIADLEKAIAAGSSRAGLELADYNMTKQESSQKLKQSRDLYERYAQQGVKSAQVKLGYLYEQGIGVQQNYQQAFHWYSVAAEQGYPEAQYLLGRLYQFGLVGGSPDYVVAKQWYALAQSTYPAAAIAYGFIDETVDDNYQHALNEYQQGADLQDPIASYNLGLIYEMGKHQDVSLTQAEDAYLRAANQGVVKAMVRLGVVYALEKNIQKAVPWLTKAATLGDSDADYQLGLINQQGLGKAPEIAEAVQYYRQAATNGHANAMLVLAKLYQDGVVVNKDLVQAAGYYKQLAQQDNPDAQYQLALFCVSGALSDCNPQQGKIWLQKAQVNGHREAARMLRLYSAKTQEGISYIESVSLQNLERSS
jgi:enhanced entry protein EnhC